MVTTHGPLPVQAPFQRVNTVPAVTDGVSVTWLPCTKSATHVAPQSRPPGVERTVPPAAPGPSRVTTSSYVGSVSKLTVSSSAASIVSVQVVRVQPGWDQPETIEPGAAAAVSVTIAPLG